MCRSKLKILVKFTLFHFVISFCCVLLEKANSHLTSFFVAAGYIITHIEESMYKMRTQYFCVMLRQRCLPHCYVLIFIHYEALDTDLLAIATEDISMQCSRRPGLNPSYTANPQLVVVLSGLACSDKTCCHRIHFVCFE